jgi:small-conductance mechanosensitive channel
MVSRCLCLFVLNYRKPYGIGDRVFFNTADEGTNTDGSAGWFVRDITLYHTTLVFGATNECCTVANGTLANLRVINAARSPKSILYIYLKFGTDVPWAKIQVFEKALRAFVQSRPREWLGVLGFMTTSRCHCHCLIVFFHTKAQLTFRRIVPNF